MKRSRKIGLLLGISLCSVICALLMAEIFLRGSSALIRTVQQKETSYAGWASARKSKEVINILALGDSYTFGGFGKNHYTYPNELNRLFLGSGKHSVSIMNQGVCESTSKQVLEPLASTLLFSHADIVLLLVGSADLFDPYPFTDELLSASEKLEKGIKSLRFYKVVKYLLDRAEVAFYEMKIGAKESAETSESADQRITAIRNVSSQIFKLSSQELNDRFLLLEAQRKKSKELQVEIDYALTSYLLRKDDDFFEIIESQIDDVNATKGSQDQCKLQMELDDFLRFAKDRFEIEGPHSGAEEIKRNLHAIRLGIYQCARNSVWKLVRAVAFNRVEANTVLENFDLAVKRFPYLKMDKRTISAQLALKNQKVWREKVAVWYEENMKKIIAETKKENVLLVLQTYPIRFAPINEIIRKLSAEFKLPLVDHEKIFAPLLATRYKDYILNDTHCTDRGHQLMAENVYKVLNGEILSDKNVLESLIKHNSMREVR